MNNIDNKLGFISAIALCIFTADFVATYDFNIAVANWHLLINTLNK